MEIIVTFSSNARVFKEVISNFDVSKLTLFCLRKDLATVLRHRNTIALENRLPVEVVHFEKPSVLGICKRLSPFNGVGVCLASSNTDFDNSVLSASYVTGKKAFYFVDGQPKFLPGLRMPLKSLLSDVQLSLLKAVKEFGPIELSSLARLNNFNEMILDKDLMGNNNDSGLVQMGLVGVEDSKVSITPNGKLILQT